MQATRLSVALVTRNRPVSLERTLKSLRGQSVQPWEAIVSDDSEEAQAREMERIALAYDCRYLRGPGRGLYANRNHAALACSGTHIRTMDDDHEFPDAHFAECRKALDDDPGSIWIIGEYYPDTKDRRAPPPCPAQLHPRGFSSAPEDPDRCWAISDGASIYPRIVFDRGIRYVERFKFGAAYLELGSRLYWLGYRIRQLRTTYVIHHFDPLARSFADPKDEMSSRFFAMLCHAYTYQPTLTNKLLCALELAKQGITHSRIAGPALMTALDQYRRYSPSPV